MVARHKGVQKRGTIMKTLIAEDDFASRKSMLRFLEQYGECDVVVDGKEAVEAFEMAVEIGAPYDLLCLDIMMPIKDGYQVLEEIRANEAMRGVLKEEQIKVIMTTALSEGRNVTRAFEMGCEAYAGKPVDQDKFENMLKKLELI